MSLSDSADQDPQSSTLPAPSRLWALPNSIGWWWRTFKSSTKSKTVANKKTNTIKMSFHFFFGILDRIQRIGILQSCRPNSRICVLFGSIVFLHLFRQESYHKRGLDLIISYGPLNFKKKNLPLYFSLEESLLTVSSSSSSSSGSISSVFEGEREVGSKRGNFMVLWAHQGISTDPLGPSRILKILNLFQPHHHHHHHHHHEGILTNPWVNIIRS